MLQSAKWIPITVALVSLGCSGERVEPPRSATARVTPAAMEGTTPQPTPQPLRWFDAPLLVSRESPAVSIRIDPEFSYLGNTTFILSDKAKVDRHHFVEVDGSVVRRMIVVHFEGFVDGVDSTYRFGMPERMSGGNYRMSPERVRLGEFEYRHNTWAFSMDQSVAARPEAESARTRSLLAEHGLSIDDALIMSRFARAVGEDRRNELLLFYFERLGDTGLTLDELQEESPMSEAFDRLSTAVTERSLAAIAVVDG